MSDAHHPEDGAGDLAATLSRFADRLFQTDGAESGAEALEIPGPRLAVYHELVRGNYLSMLRFAYTRLFRLLDHEGEQAAISGLPPRAYGIVVRFLQHGPATTHSTREIADRFRPFMESEFSQLFDARPEVADLMDLERAELRARYAVDDPGRSPTADELAPLASATVDEFLALQLIRAPSSTTQRASTAVVTLAHQLAEHQFEDSETLRTPECAAITRNPATLLPIAFAVEPPALGVFEAAAPGAVVTAEALAGAWMEALPPDDTERDDEWKLSTFANAVVTGLQKGALRLA